MRDSGMGEVENLREAPEKFPGDRLAEMLGVPERVRRTLAIVARMKHVEHAKAPKSEFEFYHSEEAHIDVVMEAAVSAGEAAKSLTEDGRERVVQCARAFVELMSGGVNGRKRDGVAFTNVLNENEFSKEENEEFTDDDLVLEYTALAFHDVGRFQLPAEGVEQGTRRTKMHEARSVERMREIFTGDEYKEMVGELAQAYPQLFGPENLEKTLAKLSYMIYWTKYVRKDGEEEETYAKFGLAPEEKKKMDFLGALAITLDIGTMQVKSSTFHSMVGLVDEYLSDVEVRGTDKLFANVEGWVLKWTTENTLPMSINVMQMLKSTAYAPSFLDERGRITYIDPEEPMQTLISDERDLRKSDPRRHLSASATAREKLVEYIESQGVARDQTITWNQLKTFVDGFVGNR